MRTTLSSTPITRTSAAIVFAALAAGLTLAVVPQAQAAPLAPVVGADPTPAALGATYLAAQPEASGIIQTYYSFQGTAGDYPDYGLTIDAATALDAVGSQSARVAQMTAALEADASSYYNDFSGTGAAAKLAAYLQGQGSTGPVLTGLVTAVEGHVDSSGPTTGRLYDGDSDFNSPLTQALAVDALNGAGSSVAAPALAFLFEQQCTEGFFRTSFAGHGSANQTCDGAASPIPSIDTTAIAVLSLQDQKTASSVIPGLAAAVTWLLAQQAADGSFGNANTTGLTGWALGASGQDAAAARAAGWLRARQLANAGRCAPYATADSGALAVDDLGLLNAGAGAFSRIDNSVATRATAQALPALLWAAGGAGAGDSTLSVPDRFAKTGSTSTLTVTGAPGETVCVSGVGTPLRVSLDARGLSIIPVTVPAVTGVLTLATVDTGGEVDFTSITALAATEVKVKLRTDEVRRGAKVVVRLGGLTPGEDVRVKFQGRIKHKSANTSGKLKMKIRATKVGTSKLRAIGEFKFRRGTSVVTVTR